MEQKVQPTHPKALPLPGMLLFELLYKVFIWAAILPLFRLILNLALTVSGGYQIAFNNSIWGFLLTVLGIIAAVILLALSSVFTYVEFFVLITLSGYGLEGRQPSLRFLLREAKASLRNLWHPSTLVFCLYVLVLLPISGIGFASSLLPAYAIPNFIAREVYNFLPSGIFVDALILFGAILILLTAFTMPVMILQKCSFGKAFMRGLRFTGRYKWRLIGVYADSLGCGDYCPDCRSWSYTMCSAQPA